jgi:TIR domain
MGDALSPKAPSALAGDRVGSRFHRFTDVQSCPEFEFEPCHWRFVPKSDDDDPFEQVTMWAHQWFDAHPQHFSLAIEKLLAAQTAVAPFAMSILPSRGSLTTAPTPPARTPSGRTKADARAGDLQYDIAISFAGSQRDFAERIATRVRDAGFRVFYDNFYPEDLWGKDLAVFFDDVFRKKSRFCLVLISKEYLERPWTEHERRSAVARMIAERGREYLLPIQIDPVELPGLASTIGYLSADRYSADEIADLLIAKLRKNG